MMFLMMLQMWKRAVEGPTRIQTTVEGEWRRRDRLRRAVLGRLLCCEKHGESQTGCAHVMRWISQCLGDRQSRAEHGSK